MYISLKLALRASKASVTPKACNVALRERLLLALNLGRFMMVECGVDGVSCVWGASVELIGPPVGEKMMLRQCN